MLEKIRDYALRTLFIDLNTREVSHETLDEDASRTFLGGRGIGAWLLSAQPTIGALEPEARLIFSTGPLTGSRIPASARMTVSAFSPLTGTIGNASVGGRLALQMKRSCIDVICITGRADRQTTLEIEDGKVRFTDSDIPADMPLSSIFESFRSFKGSVAAVGSAAFSGCSYASIMVDGSFASGRGGLGRVMGAKNLRALAIRGSNKTDVYDHEKEELARTDIIRLFDASPAIMGRSGISRYGTAALVDLIASRRMMPTANFRRTYFEDYRAFSASRIKEAEQPSNHACHGCPIACKKRARHEIPEYETLSHFGALNENPDLDSIIEANKICNEAGMDTITAAATIACLAEIRGERYVAQALVNKVKDILSARGDGQLLQLGSAVLAREMGTPEKSMSVKSMEMPAYDPRGVYGMALAYGTSTRGACHLRAYPIAHEILRKPVATDRFTFSGKARIIKIAEDLNAIIDSIGGCKFAFLAASLEEYAKGLAAVTGLDYDTQDLLRLGDDIYTLERHINTLRGFRREDDMLPERFFTEPGTSGPGIDVRPIDRNAFDEALSRYYRIRGCNEDGTLTQERAGRLMVCRNR
ncbi:MAG TPA: aldehyde ferredoxin oxidoreductase family protein [Deltaproteobacteria bacterium]|nr:aldehyde ferredoxin oxidoreductase family protein [Deltaproteobacteria bacterium]